MAPVFADRVKDIEPFRVVEVLTRAREMSDNGIDVIHMEVGEPDFTTAQPIIDAAKKALDDGATFYSSALGLPELREKIAEHYESCYGLKIPSRRILITPGASGALLLASALLINPGEGMLMADPGYPCNRTFLKLFNGEGQLVPVGAEEHYQLTAKSARESWQKNTVGALVASPANPTGEILDRESLKDLYEFVASKNGALIVDEIYHGLTYDSEATSILEITDEAFVINSFSKYFGMTGWRLGWMVAPESALAELDRLAQNLFISMSTMAQYGALACFSDETKALLEQRKEQLKQRRDFLVPALRDIGFGVPNMPGGALYVYANIERFSDDSTAFCKEMLEKHHVAITPGADFGSFKASKHVRFAYTTSMDQLQKGVERLARALK